MMGLFALWIVVGSPLAAMDHHLLTAHMAQHLLLMTVAAPLILLGAPAIASSRVAGRIASHPVFCWLAGTVTVIGWHVPALFELGMRTGYWHAIEHASFFAAGLLFWLPVIPPSLAAWPRWNIPLYLFLATLPCDALSAFLTFCGRVVYPHYASVHRMFDISPLGDQEIAGALMWVWVTFAYLVPAAVVTMQILSPQRRPLNAEAI
jgi:cytochrome c oxidase assembly factor CtaG